MQIRRKMISRTRREGRRSLSRKPATGREMGDKVRMRVNASMQLRRRGVTCRPRNASDKEARNGSGGVMAVAGSLGPSARRVALPHILQRLGEKLCFHGAVAVA